MSLLEIKKDVLEYLEIQVKKDWWPNEVEWRLEAPGEQESRECVLLEAAREEELVRGNHTWKVRLSLQLRVSGLDRDANEAGQMMDVVEGVLERLSTDDFRQAGTRVWHCYRLAVLGQANLGKDEDLYIAAWDLEAVVQF